MLDSAFQRVSRRHHNRDPSLPDFVRDHIPAVIEAVLGLRRDRSLLDSLGEEPTLLSSLGVIMSEEAELLPGTLDLLILKAVSLGPLHGYAVLSRIEQISGKRLFVEQGALYPALFRLVRQGLLKTEWGKSENNRRAKFYELTAKGRRRLRQETEGWNRLASAIGSALAARPSQA